MWEGRRVSIVFPCYNEEEGIAAAVRDFASRPYVDEVLVVDNNSRDRSAELAREAGARVVQESRQGYGYALRRGMREAQGDLVILSEPDGTFTGKDVVKLLAYSDDFSMVLGTRTTRELIWAEANKGIFLRLGNLFAAMLGIVTPFCSCSAVPLFIGFVESGIPLGVTFSFLIAAPTINEVAIVMLFGLFGWKVAGLYIASGLLIATLAGIVIGRFRMEKDVEDFVWQMQSQGDGVLESLTWSQRFSRAWDSVREIVGKVWLYVVIGIAVGAGIHGYVPQDALVSIMGKSAWWSVPAAVLLGVPLYSNAAGVIPIVSALMEKGASLGTVLAFMMSVVGLSLPEVIILRRVLKPRLIAVFIGVVALAIIITGYLFNLVM